ncbi:MAG: asparagine synthetase B, partial [Ignavibacteriales bacterium]|nr:asparagine synthetase B [Ignavibacteriales bacterium]
FLLLPPFIKKSNIFFQKGYLQEEFASLYSKQSKIIDELYSSENLQAALFDHFEHKLEHLLKWEDRNSMFFSIESRVPFLDYRLVEKTLASVPDMKIKNGITKSILREAMKGILPEKIRLRKDKIGFSTPEEEWFINEKFQKIILDILNSESFKNRKIVDVEKAKQLYKKHINREIQISGDIWKWINLELWFRAYID